MPPLIASAFVVLCQGILGSSETRGQVSAVCDQLCPAGAQQTQKADLYLLASSALCVTSCTYAHSVCRILLPIIRHNRSNALVFEWASNPCLDIIRVLDTSTTAYTLDSCLPFDHGAYSLSACVACEFRGSQSSRFLL